MPTDIFPEIDIPVISVIWNYGGLPPDEMEKRIITNYERTLTTTVNDIEHIESQSLDRHRGHRRSSSSPARRSRRPPRRSPPISQTSCRAMPPGATPPLIIRYSASNVPILQARARHRHARPSSSSSTTATNFLRADMATVQGAQMPLPYGGKQRQIMVDIDPARLYALRSLAARREQRDRGAERRFSPSGTAKLGANEYPFG